MVASSRARLFVIISCCLLSLAMPASASLSDRQRCLVAKHKAVGKHQACLLKDFAGAVARGDVPDGSECDDKLAASFAAAEVRYGLQCTTSGDSALLASRGADLASSLDSLLGASAAGDAAACVAARLAAASRYASCGEKAAAAQIAKDLARRDTAKCEAKLAGDVARSESSPPCPAAASEDLRAAVDAAFGEVEADLADLGTDDFARRGRYRASSTTRTFVDAARPTDANGSYAGAPERTLVATISYPAALPYPDSSFAEVPGPLPLVIRAHGYSGFRADSTDLMNHLASRGMIVVSPDFPLSTLTAPGGPTVADVDEQARDIAFLIDQMIALGATPGSFFEGRIDASRIGVIGHSLGGATVLVAGYHATLSDPRIDAVVAMAPLACLFQEPFFAAAGAPLMILSGTGDLVTPPQSNQVDVYDRADPEKYLVSLDGGLHIGFSNDFLDDDSVNADDTLACPAVLPEGSPRPVSMSLIAASLPPDFLGGAAAGVDLTLSTCEPICPAPSGSWMAHDRQRDIELAAAAAMFEKALGGSVSAARLLTQRLDAENDDVSVSFELLP